MYKVTVKAQKLTTGEIEMGFFNYPKPLAVADVREKLLAKGWIALGIWNDIKQ